MRNLLHRLGLFLLLALSPSALSTRDAFSQSVSEDDVKAAMVFNFLRFSTLPNPSDKILLCVLSNYPGVNQIRALDGKSLGSSPVRIEIVEESAVLTRAQCQVAVYGELSPKAAGALQSLTRSGVLTIGQDAGFLERGGVIRFFSESNRVRFEIDNESARSAGITISSKVLALARIKGSSD